VDRLSRRELLALIETIAASMALGSLGACKGKRREPDHDPASATPATPAAPPRALDARTFRALEAATARILPGRPDFAGAREAQVMTFIERQLAIEPFVRLAPGLVALARGLDAQGPTPFAALDVVEQDRILGELAHGRWADATLPQRELFVVLHSLTLEGFLADPNHGGNHGGAGWKAIDFAEPSLRTPGAPGAHGNPHGGGHGHGP
jgi:gluconate 2-dehydrogenase gamma chain